MWHIYIVTCADGTYYTGIAKNLDDRIAIHNQAKGAKYTRARLPVKLAYTENAPDRSLAQKREFAIKQLSRIEKRALIKGWVKS